MGRSLPPRTREPDPETDVAQIDIFDLKLKYLKTPEGSTSNRASWSVSLSFRLKPLRILCSEQTYMYAELPAVVPVFQEPGDQILLTEELQGLDLQQDHSELELEPETISLWSAYS